MMLFSSFCAVVQFLIHNWNVLLARMESWRANSPFFAEYSLTVDISKSPHAQIDANPTKGRLLQKQFGNPMFMEEKNYLSLVFFVGGGGLPLV